MLYIRLKAWSNTMGYYEDFKFEQKDYTSRYQYAFSINKDKINTNDFSEALFKLNKFIPVEFIEQDSKLGNGAFGDVFKGKLADRDIAIKNINMDKVKEKFKLDDIGAKQTINWEVITQSRLKHPHLVECLGITQEDNPRIILEFCDGGTLSNAIEQDDAVEIGSNSGSDVGSDFGEEIINLAHNKCWKFAIEIVEGLIHLHEQGMLHRDLKSENVLIDRNGYAKLADFGVSQVDSLISKDEAAVISKNLKDFRYAAPEEFTEGTATSKSDIFSFGIILLELFGGVWHNNEKFLSASKKADITEANMQLPSIPECPKVVSEIISNCWKYNPNERPDAKAIKTLLIDYAEQLHESKQEADKAILRHQQNLELYFSKTYREFYQAPFIAHKDTNSDWDIYWLFYQQNPELEKKDIASFSNVTDSFLNDTSKKVLVFYGDGGVGKSISLDVIREKLLLETELIPIYIKTQIDDWSLKGLDNALEIAANKLGVTDKSLSIVFLVDGIDELANADMNTNICQLLRLNDWPNAKLIFTSRRSNRSDEKDIIRFSPGDNSALTVKFMLPFKVEQLISFTQKKQNWDDATTQKWQESLAQTTSLRAMLRNPFVLSLFADAWPILKDYNPIDINDYLIYQSYVKQWLSASSNLLDNKVIAEIAPNNLYDDYLNSAAGLAYKLFAEEKTVSRFAEEKDQWLNITDIIAEAATSKYEESRANSDSEHRNLLSKDQYIDLQLLQGKYFLEGNPLQLRVHGYSFRHKTFLEWGVANAIYLAAKTSNNLALAKYLDHKIFEITPSIGLYLSQHLKSERFDGRSEAADSSLLETIRAKEGFSAKWAITFLNQSTYKFRDIDLSGVNIPGADLTACDMDGVDLSDANLTSVKLTQAKIASSTFNGANLKDINWGQTAVKYSGIKQIIPSPDGASYSIILTSWDIKVMSYNALTEIKEIFMESPERMLLLGDYVYCSSGKQLYKIEISNAKKKEIYSSNRSISAVELSHDKSKIAVCSWREIALINISDNSKLSLKYSVNSKLLAFTSDNRFLSTEGQHLYIWDLSEKEPTKKRLFSYEKNATAINYHAATKRLACSDEGLNLIISSYDNSTFVEEVKLKTPYQVTENGLNWHSNGQWLTAGLINGWVLIWDTTQWAMAPRVIIAHNKDAIPTFNHDGSKLLTGGGDGFRIWNWVESAFAPLRNPGINYPIIAIAKNNNSAMHRLLGLDGKINAWSPHSTHTQLISSTSGNKPNVISMSNDGKHIIWSSGNGILTVKNQDHQYQVESNGLTVRSICFSNDNTRVASYHSGNNILIWSLKETALDLAYQFKSDLALKSMDFTLEHLLTLNADGIIRFNEAENKEISSIDDVESYDLNRPMTTLATTYKNVINIFNITDVSKPQIIHTLTTNLAKIKHLKFSTGSNSLLAILDNMGSIFLGHLNSKEVILVSKNIKHAFKMFCIENILYVSDIYGGLSSWRISGNSLQNYGEAYKSKLDLISNQFKRVLNLGSQGEGILSEHNQYYSPAGMSDNSPIPDSLLEAAEKGHTRGVKHFIESKSDINAVDGSGKRHYINQHEMATLNAFRLLLTRGLT